MDKQGLRTLLQTRKFTEKQIEAAIAIAGRFEAYLADKMPTAESAWAFSKILIGEGNNTRENYLALASYCLLIRDLAMYTAMSELIDYGEVGDNLYRRVAERFGQEVRDEVFAGIGVVPYGTPTPEKPAYMHPVVERLEAKIGEQACKDFLSGCLETFQDERYLPEREKYRQAGDMDEYLEKRRQTFLSYLETCKRDNALYYIQEVTDEMIDFLRSVPEIRGVRRGNIVYEVKEPYQIERYLAEKDPTLKRYYYCHCQWAREAIKRGNVKLAPTFCNCSAGFHKKAFEIIFGQPLRAEVLESVLKGDDRCRFAIHLPEDAIAGK